MRGRRTIISTDIYSYSAHPRVHGADTRTIRKKSCCMGSSPCIRGKLLKLLSFLGAHRLIPVHTGQMLNLSGRFPHLLSYCFPSSWTSATEPVCIILDSHIFADNTFGSILARNDTWLPIFLRNIPRHHHIFVPLTAFSVRSQIRI